MMSLLVFKERLKNFYQKYDLYIEPVVKFLTALIIILLINQNIGYDNRLKSLPIVLVLSLLSAFMPSSVMVLLASCLTIAHVYSVSSILALIVLVILFIMYFLFIRFTPKQGYIVMAIPILFILKIPYAVPILMGLVAGPISIISISCGVITYYLFLIIKEAATVYTSSTIEDTLTLYKNVIDSLLSNQMMMITIFAFAAVLLVTFFFRRLNVDHAFDIAIAAGAIVNILIFLIGDLKMDTSNQIVFMLFGTLMSCAIVYIIQFFRLTLEYTAVERVQFEDDDYYYYVKAVPKRKVTTPEKNVKRINISHNTGSLEGIQKEFNLKKDFDLDEDYSEGFDNEMFFDK